MVWNIKINVVTISYYTEIIVFCELHPYFRKSEGVDIPSEHTVYRIIQENRMKRYFPWPLTASTMPLFRSFIKSSNAPEVLNQAPSWLPFVRKSLPPGMLPRVSVCFWPFLAKLGHDIRFRRCNVRFCLANVRFFRFKVRFQSGWAHSTRGCEKRVPETLSSHEFLF